MNKNQPTIWLIGLQTKADKPRGRLRQWLHRWLGRRWPQRWAQDIGRLPDNTPVRLLELPYTKADFRALPPEQRRRLLQHALHWLAQPNQQTRKIGMPLRLQTLLPAAQRPALLADGWQLAAQEFIRQSAAELGGMQNLQGRQAAILGVEASSPLERHICDALLAAGSRPVLYGSRALGLAEYYYQKYGIAIPVFGARKAIRSSQIIYVLQGRRPPTQTSKALFYFREPHVSVPGRFCGRFSFGSFCAGQAAALLNSNQDAPANITLDK